MKNSYKIWIIISMITVFAAGFVCGILVENGLLEKDIKKSKRDHDSVHFPTLEMMAEELDLMPEQQDRIRQYFRDNEKLFKNLRGEIHSRLRDIRTQLINDIKSVLDERQKERFEAMIERYMAQKKREHEERIKHRQKFSNRKGEEK